QRQDANRGINITRIVIDPQLAEVLSNVALGHGFLVEQELQNEDLCGALARQDFPVEELQVRQEVIAGSSIEERVFREETPVVFLFFRENSHVHGVIASNILACWRPTQLLR